VQVARRLHKYAHHARVTHRTTLNDI
jgi:hypothetical protein